MSSVEVEQATIDHLEFDVLCEVVILGVRHTGPVPHLAGDPERCRKPASGWLECRMCGSTAPVCGEHARTVMAMPNLGCAKCGRTGRGSYLFRFVPMGGD